MDDTSSLITGGAAVASQAINAYSTERANKKNRKFAEDMYNKQREDNERMWNMTNTYNSPQEQMKRLQEAGLNPNLIYGSGSQTGGTASPTTAPSSSFKAAAPQFDLGSAVGTAFDRHFNTQLKVAQLDNLKAQNDVIRQEALYKSVQTDALSTQNALSVDAYDFDLQGRQQKAELLGTQHVIKENELEILRATKQTTIESAVAKLAQLRYGAELTKEQIQTMNQNQQVQQMNIELQKNGIRPNDPIYYRLIGMFLSKFGFTIK